MAEIPFADYGRDDDDGLNSEYICNEFGFDDIDTPETIIPIDKIEQYILSENCYTRQLVAGGLLDVLRNTKDSQERAVVLDALNKLAQDEEPSVRTEVAEHIPHIADYCVANSPHIEGLSNALSTAILPSLVRCLHDTHNQVRKTTQSALIILLENRLIDQVDVEELICPVLMDLFLPEMLAEEHRTEAVSLMVRISLLVSKDVVEKLFLPKFCELCSESMFHIRKVCATSIGEMCRIVGPQLAEQYLLPKFFNLCEDGIWGVRKACTECFMDVSSSLSPNTRRAELAQLFVGLLCDQSRWVRMSAFQALGPFISTFANPDSTGLYFDDDGILRVRPEVLAGASKLAHDKIEQGTLQVERVPKEQIEQVTAEQVGQVIAETVEQVTDEVTPASLSALCNQVLEVKGDLPSGVSTSPMQDMQDVVIEGTGQSVNSSTNSSECLLSFEEVRLRQYTENTELVYQPGQSEQSKIADDFYSFKYWREPLPKLDLTSILKEVSSSEQQLEALASTFQQGIAINTVSPAQSISQPQDQCQSYMFGPASTPHSTTIPTYASVLAKPSVSTQRTRHQSNESSGAESMSSLSELMAKQQDIIPHLLLENYLSMIDPSRAQTVDSDIAQHCAYSLPAVAYTLGKQNWKCLRSLYETLVSDMQWKVRRTLAFSIHELAVILGSELTQSDLVPIFNGFMKDLDEVRVGVLSHLADFLRLLDAKFRKTYLPRLSEFLETDNSRVWRSRMDLAIQLLKMCDLYGSSDVVEYILPITMQLLADRVADVRQVALPLISGILSLLKEASQDQQRLSLINDMIEKLALSTKWSARQTYVQACHRILQDEAMTNVQFCRELLPSIVTLSVDKIPNVRLAASKLVSHPLMQIGYFTSEENPHRDDLINAVKQLQNDPDRDVRYFAGIRCLTVEQECKEPQVEIQNVKTDNINC
ncbi:serine/threonine-protein phosphatase 4 regulatory subunit 1-like isoform X2 [Watersipora subatra]|uniref:serine/threonine-protein phosphatase 4 regulatory subunit 1-like isoform X2 n=1 Tax=Watersipora subatra TaxID=2589382 RepID=UPI00355B9D18